MKNLKKFFAMALALMLVISMAVPVSAADDTFTLTVNQADENHEYDVYQIFAGDLLDGTTDNDESTNGIILSNIKWGSSIVKAGDDGYDYSTALVHALRTDSHEIKYQSGGSTVTTTLSAVFNSVQDNVNTAAAIANILGANQPTAVVDRFAEVVGEVAYKTDNTFDYHKYMGDKVGTADKANNYQVTGLDAGYYLIKDTDGSQTGEDSFYTKYILQVLHSVTVNPKGSSVKVDKSINDTLDGTYENVEDFDISDTAYYKWTGTMPTNLSSYDTYYYKFTDTLPTGIAYTQFEQIYIENADGERVHTFLDLHDQSTTNDTVPSGMTIVDDGTVTIDDKNYTQISVEFSDLKALYGGLSADSIVVVKYSALVNRFAVSDEAMVNTVFLEFDNNPDGEGIGKTTSDYAHAFTFELGIHKYDQNDTTKPLEGVQFLLYFTRSHTETDAEGQEQVVTKYYYAKVITEEMVEKDESVNGVPVTAQDIGVVYGWTEDRNEASVLDTDNQGNLTVRGLDAGTYYLEETTTVEGYNLLEDVVTVKITPTYTEVASEEAQVTVEYAVNGTPQGENTVVDIPNARGNTLPSTGGIGTTIFYALGGILVVAAVIVLITKKRMA